MYDTSSRAVAGIMHSSRLASSNISEDVMNGKTSAVSRTRRPRFTNVRKHSVVAFATALLSTTAIAACAMGHTPRGGDQQQEQQYVVHLTNNLAPPSDVTVYAVSEGGTRRLMGDVPPNQDRALTIPNNIFPGTSFRIVAEGTSGRGILSQPITASSGGGMIKWDLQTNAMWFPQSGQ